jgi:alpha-L-fucosidase
MRRSIVTLILSGLVISGQAAGPVKPELESLQKHFKSPEWLADAKFGVFMCWGPVTWAIQHDETGRFGWYASSMYREGSIQNEYHKKHYGDPKEVGYKDLYKNFTASRFDPDEWADLITDAGAKFAGPLSIHHDNFAMWDSEIHPWNAADMGPKKDICGIMAQEFRERDVKFIATFHHGFTYPFYKDARKPEYDGHDPKYAKHYGPVDTRDKERKFIPREFQEQWLALVNEFTHKYKPDFIYFDFGLGWQDKDLQYEMYADYYNLALENNMEVTVLQKERDELHRTFSTMDLERGRMDELTDYVWTTDTSPGPWFNHKNPRWETPDTMIDMLVDIVSKNGVMFLSVAPDAEGAIPPPMRNILEEYGKWLKVNGEGIYGSRPWPIYGEGTVTTGAGHFKIENSKAKDEAVYSGADIRYTRSKDGQTVYAFTLGWPEEREVTFHALEVFGKGTVEMLGHGVTLDYRINPDKTITVTYPEKQMGDHAHGIKFTGFELKPHPAGHFYLPSCQRIPANRAVLHGIKSLGLSADANGEQRIHGWKSWWGQSHWMFPVRLKNRTIELRCLMINRSADNTVAVTVFNHAGERHEFEASLPQTGETPEYVSLGSLPLPHDGVYHLSIGSRPNKLKPGTIEIYELQAAPVPESLH